MTMFKSALGSALLQNEHLHAKEIDWSHGWQGPSL